MQFINLIVACVRMSKLTFLLSLMLILQACSGGSGGGGSDRADVVTSSQDVFQYSGPVPANSTIQNFKTAFYDNVVERCSSCHTRGGVGTTAFVDVDDVNVAYNEALTVVNLLDPSSSDVVTRVANGHNCWLNSNAACASTMTGYIERWAQGASDSVSTVTLLPRTPKQLAGLKVAPASYSDAVNDMSFNLATDPELMYLLNTYCSGCHSGSSSTPQSPYFASDNLEIAYSAMVGKIDLGNPANSRFVIRLQENHNCWTDCSSDATTMQNAIQRFADDLPVVSVDSDLVISTAQILEDDGIIASAGGRYETDVIAKWEFREGEGASVADTSGVQPEIPLTLQGNFEWFGGWGARLIDGRVQGSVEDSAKLYDRLATAGEYTIEAWVAPNNVSQEDAWIFGYAGGPTDRNVLLTQTLYNYDFYNRSNANPQSDGGPATSTDDDDEFAQASLQHVVLTYDPIDGRKIYVNGTDTGVIDEEGPGTLTNWSNQYSVVLGSNFSGGSSWEGVIRMVAVHSRSLTPEQIVQNYDVGVGQKYYLMFSISEVLDLDGTCHEGTAPDRTDYCYIVFEVSQFDNTSYLFREPRFVNINPNANNAVTFDLKGIYLGMNGQLVRTGQGFVNIDASFDGTTFTIDDAPLQTHGTIIPLENGPENDVFFLAFDEISGQLDQRTDPAIGAFTYSYQDDEQVQIGMRTFDEVNQTYSSLTGVPIDNPSVSAATGKTVSQTFNTVRRSLASVADFQTFMASHQMAVMQLAAAYCDALVEDATLSNNFFVDVTDDVTVFNMNAAVNTVSDPEWTNQVITPLVNKIYATGLGTQPSRPDDVDIADVIDDRVELIDELELLVTDTSDNAAGEELNPDGKPDGLIFCAGSPTDRSSTTCSAGRTAEVVKAVCTAVLSSAPAIMK